MKGFTRNAIVARNSFKPGNGFEFQAVRNGQPGVIRRRRDGHPTADIRPHPTVRKALLDAIAAPALAGQPAPAS